ncbi:hypothetical protein BG015_008106 [Linnemannia schmuckeri]|uniref:Zn(2)-C6 fungal-type domain-containing protein n=1 Tax=Linnemannia schmuckeri TaxID=64567 RepID=A0A9P5RXU3_9FUNG|nr:hypothetical protein BG015_008106 [Linnemannia schmuckeri]
MTFSGLLHKSLKHHAAAATNSAAAAGATKPGAVANATTATATTSTGTTQEQHTHIQNTIIVSPKTDSASIPGSVLSTMASPSPPQPISIDPTVLSIDPRSSSPSQQQLLSSQQPTTSKLDMKQPVAPAPLSPPSTTPSSPAATGTIPITTTKKKQQQQQQNLSASQSASYRKRLNVNQVCDWCRYRKIRCDREAPCNSCQHSKRECIRTPPEVLLSKLNNKETENSSTAESTATKATKRNCPADEQEDQTSLLKAKKVARNTGIVSSSSSHINIEHNNNNSNTASMRLSPTISGPLSLSPPSTTGLTLCGEQQQQRPMTMLSSEIPGTSSSLQDQEHLERMRRIEMLLSNVIPGAAEFIAHGHHHQRSNSFSTPSNNQHGQHQQQRIMSPISPALTAAGSPLGLALIQDDTSDFSSPIQEDRGTRLGGEGQQQHQQGRRPSLFAGQDYIERMKRIELLLGSVQDSNAPVTKLSLAVPPSAGADTTGESSKNDNAKKEPTPTTRKNKAAGTKKVARNSDGTIIKRPHVAAGFAGQKPPPKLPQAIAEAALKKLAGKKKKRASAATNSASATAAAATVAPVVTVAPSAATVTTAAPAVAVTVDGAPASPTSTITTATAPTQGPSAPQTKTEAPAAVTLSSPKSFDIPTTIDNHHHQIQENTVLSFTQQQLQLEQQQPQKDRAKILARQQQQHQQQQLQQQQHPRPGRLNTTQLRTSGAYPSHHPHHQHKQQHTPAPPSSYVGGGHMTNIGSISIPTIPLSNTMASYESLVVPACNSADSSPASSPRTSTTTIEFPTIGGSSSGSVSGAESMSPLAPMDFLAYGTSSPHSSFPTMHNAGGADFSMTLNMIHPTGPGTADQLISPIDGTTTNNQVFLPFATTSTQGAASMYSPHFHFLQQQQPQAMHIPQDNTNNNTGMTESLESWMNSQLVPSLDVFSNPNSLSLTHTNSPFLAGGGFGQQQLQHQHRPSIQHQHQQSFYIPQMHDDDEEDDGANEVSHE